MVTLSALQNLIISIQNNNIRVGALYENRCQLLTFYFSMFGFYAAVIVLQNCRIEGDISLSLNINNCFFIKKEDTLLLTPKVFG